MCRIAARTVAERAVYTAGLMPLGPRLRRGLAVGAAALALAPSAAFAQGAGDDQYSDPFGSDQEEATPAPTPRAPAATPAPAQTPAPSQAGPAATAAPPPPQAPSLPYTGLEDWLPGAAGALLLSAGLMLRARLNADERS
jgi:hypothetical protein